MIQVPIETLAYWQSREGEFKTASPEVVATVAKMGGGRLPADYLGFIANYGFVPWEYTVPDRFDAKVDDGGQTVVTERAVTHLWSHVALARMLENIWRDDPANGFPMLPTNMFPVAGTAGQDLILMELEPQNGRIWYWQFSNDAWGQPSNRVLGHVANSFTDFINGLRMGPLE
jgi:hypothetical protein